MNQVLIGILINCRWIGRPDRSRTEIVGWRAGESPTQMAGLGGARVRPTPPTAQRTKEKSQTKSSLFKLFSVLPFLLQRKRFGESDGIQSTIQIHSDQLGTFWILRNSRTSQFQFEGHPPASSKANPEQRNICFPHNLLWR